MSKKKRGGRGKGSKGFKGQTVKEGASAEIMSSTVASGPEVGEERREEEPTRPSEIRATGARAEEFPAFGESGGSLEAWGQDSPWKGDKDKNQKSSESFGTTEEKRVETLEGVTLKEVPLEGQEQVKKLSLAEVGEHSKDQFGALGRNDVNVQPEKMVRVARKSYFPHNHLSYDGQKLVYNAKQLPLADDVVTGKITIQTDRGKEEEFTIRIKLNGTVDLSPLNNLLQKKNAGEDEAYQCVAAVLREAFSDSFINVEKRFDLTSKQNEEFLDTREHSGKMSKDLVPALDGDLKNERAKMLSCQPSAIHHHSSTPTTERKNKMKSTIQKQDTALKSTFSQYFLSSDNLWPSELPRGISIQEWRVIAVEVRREVVNSQIDVLIKMLTSLGATSGITFSHPEDTIYITNQETDLVSCYQKNKSLQLMVVVVPDLKDTFFWKKRALESAIHWITAGTLFKMNEATVRNILQKITAARPWDPQPKPYYRPTRS